MESFLEFIFANFFIVLIVVGFIINFFSKNRNEEERKQQRERRESPLPDLRETRTYDRARETVQQTKQQLEQRTEATAKTIEEQRQEQYERLRSQYQTAYNEEDAKKALNQAVQGQTSIKRKEEVAKVDIHLDKKLTSAEGLIESVIMAEVLGPPRALNPYQNIVAKRKYRL